MPLLAFEECLNRKFRLRPNDDGTWAPDQMAVAVLMDIRTELRAIRQQGGEQIKLLRSMRRAMPPRQKGGR